MKKFPFLRRPARLILYALLLALVTTAALIFAWQYKLDGIILDHAIDTYAYVGTVVRSDGEIMDSNIDRDLADLYGITPQVGGPAFLEEIPGELVEWLYDSDLVSRIDNRRTLAAQVGEYTQIHREVTSQTTTIADYSMRVTSVQSYHYLEGTVMEVKCWSDPEEEFQSDNLKVRVDRMWNDPNYSYDFMVVNYDRLNGEPQLQEGQRVFLIGANSGTASRSMDISTPKAFKRVFGDDFPLNTAEQNNVLLIPEDVDSEAYIQSFLESTGLDKALEAQLRDAFSVTVRQSQDMMMIPLFAQGKAKTYEGRVLTPADMGTKVCVISYALSQRNLLSVGDIIRLSVADGCYTIPDDYAIAGWESGFSSGDEELLTYGDYEEYEIVGIYSPKSRANANTLYFPLNDIFIPAQEDTAAETPRPYSFSFRVPGPDYYAFQQAIAPVLEEYGYTLIIEDTGWDDVKETFYTMQTRRQLMLLCAVAAFAAAILVFALLLNSHCRYEYGLRRLMGASKREATGIYCSVFVFTGLSGTLVAVGSALLAAVKLIGTAMAENATAPLPTNAECALTLAAWAAAELAAILIVLLLLAWRGERRGLLRLVRR